MFLSVVRSSIGLVFDIVDQSYLPVRTRRAEISRCCPADPERLVSFLYMGLFLRFKKN
jgi:hypothetical protein